MTETQIGFSLGDNNNIPETPVAGTFYIDEITKQVKLYKNNSTSIDFDWSNTNPSINLVDYKTDNNDWAAAFEAALASGLPIVGSGATAPEDATALTITGSTPHLLCDFIDWDFTVDKDNKGQIIFNNCTFKSGHVLISNAIYNNCTFDSSYSMATLTKEKSLYDLDCQLINCHYDRYIIDTDTLQLHKSLPKNTINFYAKNTNIEKDDSGNYSCNIFLTSLESIPQLQFNKADPTEKLLIMSGGGKIIIQTESGQQAKFYTNPQLTEETISFEEKGDYCLINSLPVPWTSKLDEIGTAQENLVEVNGLIYNKTKNYYQKGVFEILPFEMIDIRDKEETQIIAPQELNFEFKISEEILANDYKSPSNYDNYLLNHTYTDEDIKYPTTNYTTFNELRGLWGRTSSDPLYICTTKEGYEEQEEGYNYTNSNAVSKVDSTKQTEVFHVKEVVFGTGETGFQSPQVNYNIIGLLATESNNSFIVMLSRSNGSTSGAEKTFWNTFNKTGIEQLVQGDGTNDYGIGRQTNTNNYICNMSDGTKFTRSSEDVDIKFQDLCEVFDTTWLSQTENLKLKISDKSNNYVIRTYSITDTNTLQKILYGQGLDITKTLTIELFQDSESDDTNLIEIEKVLTSKDFFQNPIQATDTPLLQVYIKKQNVKTDWETTTYDNYIPTIGAIKAYLSELSQV